MSNASGRKYGRWASHFDPYSPIYSRRERTEVMVSDFALTAAASGLWALARAFGWAWLLKVRWCSVSLGAACGDRSIMRPWSCKVRACTPVPAVLLLNVSTPNKQKA